MSLNVIDDYLTEDQVAEVLGMRIATLRTWVAQRKGPPRVAIGRKIHYSKEALKTWLLSPEKGPAHPQPRTDVPIDRTYSLAADAG